MNGVGPLNGSALGTMPDTDVSSVSAIGLDSIRRMMEQGDTKGAEAVLEFLNNALKQRFSADATGAAAPQPYTLPQLNGIGGSPSALLSAFGMPASGSSPASTGKSVGASRGIEDRIEGLPQNIMTALRPGTPEYTTVMASLQQHDNLHFDADTQRFFTTVSDGSKVDICSVYDAMDVFQQNGGFAAQEDVAGAALHDYFRDKVDEASLRPYAAMNMLAVSEGHPPLSVDPNHVTLRTYHTQLDDVKRKLEELEAALRVMAAPSHISQTVIR